MRKFFILLTIFIFLISCSNTTKSKTFAANKNSDFTLEQLSGGSITLSQLKGKVVLVDFWATWCPPCRVAIPHLIKLYDTYKDQGLVVLGISLDQQKEVLPKFVTENNISYPILIGNQDVAKIYDVQGIPTLIIFDKKGKIALREVGFNAENIDNLEKNIIGLLNQ